jgi:hypothetical protein
VDGRLNQESEGANEPSWQRRCAETEGATVTQVELPGLAPDGWPLGYLAAAGAFRLLAEEGGHDRLRLYWPADGHVRWTGPVLEGVPWHSAAEVADELGAIARSAALSGGAGTLPGCDPSFPPAKTGTKGGDPARPGLKDWPELYGRIGEAERRWLGTLMIPDPRGLVLHALAGGPALLPQAPAELARQMPGAACRMPDAALRSAGSWLHSKGVIKHVAAGVPGMFELGRKTAITPALRDRLTRPFLTPYMAPMGQQTVSSYFRRPLQAVRGDQALLTEALTGWRWHDGYTAENLDYRGFSDAVSTPLGKTQQRAPAGAVWLATMALPLDPLRAEHSGAIRTGLWEPQDDGLMGMSMPLWDQPLDVTQVRALFRSAGTLPGAGVWHTGQAIRLQPPGNKHSRGLLTLADLGSPLQLPLPDLEWRVSPWWADLPAQTPVLAAAGF